MREQIPVYDAVCCRTWIMPADAFGFPGGTCGYCGQVPEPVGNYRILKVHTPPQYLDPTYGEH